VGAVILADRLQVASITGAADRKVEEEKRFDDIFVLRTNPLSTRLDSQRARTLGHPASAADQ
jgi:hypothetical protein